MPWHCTNATSHNKHYHSGLHPGSNELPYRTSNICIQEQCTPHSSEPMPIADQRQTPFHLDITQLVQFIAFSILNSPPNYVWYGDLQCRLHNWSDFGHRQSFLESAFPSTHLVPSNAALRAASQNNEKELDREQKNDEILETKLHVPNTITKFALDQTIGAALNTLMFSFVIAGFKGADYGQAVQISKQDFWLLMKAGWKLWPAVSLLNFTVVKTVEGRQLVGSLAGMAWNVYLSLLAGEGPDL